MQIQNFDKIKDAWNDIARLSNLPRGCYIIAATIEPDDIHFIEFEATHLALELWKPSPGQLQTWCDWSPTWEILIYDMSSDVSYYYNSIEYDIVADLTSFIEYILPIVTDQFVTHNYMRLDDQIRWATDNIANYISDKNSIKYIQLSQFINDIRNKFGISLQDTKWIAAEVWDKYILDN